MRVLLLLVVAVALTQADSRKFVGIPSNAEVLEIQAVPASARQDRSLVIWMESPENHPRGSFDHKGHPVPLDEPYTCPELSRGWFRRGRTRISLVNMRSGKVINTVRVVTGDMRDPEDSFDVPYFIESGHYYAVPGVPAGTEGIPKLIELRDIDGNGWLLEFALYEMPACTGPDTFVFGYDVGRDRVAHYPAYLAFDGGRRHELRSSLDQLFYQKPIEPRHWAYRLYYNAGEECAFDIRFSPVRGRFEGSVQCREK